MHLSGGGIHVNGVALQLNCSLYLQVSFMSMVKFSFV